MNCYWLWGRCKGDFLCRDSFWWVENHRFQANQRKHLWLLSKWCELTPCTRYSPRSTGSPRHCTQHTHRPGDLETHSVPTFHRGVLQGGHTSACLRALYYVALLVCVGVTSGMFMAQSSYTLHSSPPRTFNLPMHTRSPLALAQSSYTLNFHLHTSSGVYLSLWLHSSVGHLKPA